MLQRANIQTGFEKSAISLPTNRFSLLEKYEFLLRCMFGQMKITNDDAIKYCNMFLQHSSNNNFFNYARAWFERKKESAKVDKQNTKKYLIAACGPGPVKEVTACALYELAHAYLDSGQIVEAFCHHVAAMLAGSTLAVDEFLGINNPKVKLYETKLSSEFLKYYSKASYNAQIDKIKCLTVSAVLIIALYEPILIAAFPKSNLMKIFAPQNIKDLITSVSNTTKPFDFVNDLAKPPLKNLVKAILDTDAILFMDFFCYARKIGMLNAEALEAVITLVEQLIANSELTETIREAYNLKISQKKFLLFASINNPVFAVKAQEIFTRLDIRGLEPKDIEHFAVELRDFWSYKLFIKFTSYPDYATAMVFLNQISNQSIFDRGILRFFNTFDPEEVNPNSYELKTDTFKRILVAHETYPNPDLAFIQLLQIEVAILTNPWATIRMLLHDIINEYKVYYDVRVTRESNKYFLTIGDDERVTLKQEANKLHENAIFKKNYILTLADNLTILSNLAGSIYAFVADCRKLTGPNIKTTCDVMEGKCNKVKEKIKSAHDHDVKNLIQLLEQRTALLMQMKQSRQNSLAQPFELTPPPTYDEVTFYRSAAPTLFVPAAVAPPASYLVAPSVEAVDGYYPWTDFLKP